MYMTLNVGGCFATPAAADRNAGVIVAEITYDEVV
jgi:hypothetical protein